MFVFQSAARPLACLLLLQVAPEIDHLHPAHFCLLLSKLSVTGERMDHPYKNEKVAARLQFGFCYYAAIKYVCNNWWQQSSQLERLVACLQQPCSFYQRLQAHRGTTRSQLQLAAVTSKKTELILYNIRRQISNLCKRVLAVSCS